MELEFSKADASDASILNGISKSAFDSDVEVGAPSKGGPPGYGSLSFHAEMARQNHLFKLTDHGRIVGGAILFPDKDMLNVGRIFVSPEHFRKGYGTHMMQEIEAMFPDAKGFTLDTPIWNVRTNRFYTKLGYSEIRRDGEVVYYLKKLARVGPKNDEKRPAPKSPPALLALPLHGNAAGCRIPGSEVAGGKLC